MGRYADEAVDMLDFYYSLCEWSLGTFGSHDVRGPVGPLKHLVKEAGEAVEAAKTHSLVAILAKKPDGFDEGALREEIADCLFLVFDAAQRAGMTFADLTAECWKKLEKNRARTWPKPSSDEPVEHVRDN